MPDIMPTSDPTPKSLTADRLEALLQMQKTDPFCKCISKCLSNGKAPKHEIRTFHPHLRDFYTNISLIPDRGFLL